MTRRTSIRGVVLAATIATLLTVSLVAQAAPTKATCSDVLDIVVHGHHVVADYVTGIGHGAMTWPPAGQVDASGGAELPGGSGRGHLDAGVAPGASFCTDSQSPGAHPGAES